MNRDLAFIVCKSEILGYLAILCDGGKAGIYGSNDSIETDWNEL